MAVYPGVYTGVHGAITVAGVAEEFVSLDITVSRKDIAVPRAGKYSQKKVPGEFDVKMSIKKTLSDGAFMGRLINGTPVSGTAETLHAGLTAPGADAENVTDMTDTSIATPSRIKFTAKTAAITVGGVAIIVGTDVNGNGLVERLPLTACIADAVSATGEKLFKTVTHVTLLGTVAAGGTVEVASVVGASSYTVGDPSIFDFVGKWDKGTPEIVFTVNNCFLTQGKTGVAAGKASEGDYELVCQDLDADFSMDYVPE